MIKKYSILKSTPTLTRLEIKRAKDLYLAISLC